MRQCMSHTQLALWSLNEHPCSSFLFGPLPTTSLPNCHLPRSVRLVKMCKSTSGLDST